MRRGVASDHTGYITRMPALSESRLLRFLMFGALYFAQGLPWGFISVGFVVFLTDQGMSNEAIGGVIGLAYLPWSFKILFGPVLDWLPPSRFGRRRPYIIAAELLMGASLLLLLPLDPVGQLSLMTAILVAHNVAAALQDVAVDALAVDVLPEDERGRANSIMWAAKSAGVALGGGGGTVLAKYAGWPALFTALALAIFAVMTLPLLFRERADSPDGPAPAPERLTLATLVQTFSFGTPFAGLAIAFLAPTGYALVGTVFTRTLRADLHLTEEAIGLLSGTVEPVAGVVGALLGGFLADRYGARVTMAAAMGLIAACLAGWALSPALWPSYSFVVGYDALLNLAIYVFGSASLGFFMSISNPAIGATHFAMYMAATNLTYAWTSPFGGWMADTYGVPALFLTAAVLQVAFVVLLPLADPAKAKARYHPDALAG